MLDCHIFNLGVTLYYSVLTAFLEKNVLTKSDDAPLPVRVKK